MKMWKKGKRSKEIDRRRGGKSGSKVGEGASCGKGKGNVMIKGVVRENILNVFVRITSNASNG